MHGVMALFERLRFLVQEAHQLDAAVRLLLLFDDHSPG